MVWGSEARSSHDVSRIRSGWLPSQRRVTATHVWGSEALYPRGGYMDDYWTCVRRSRRGGASASGGAPQWGRVGTAPRVRARERARTHALACLPARACLCARVPVRARAPRGGALIELQRGAVRRIGLVSLSRE